nr:MAG TPA: hypothetical protein [Caudoviricetes sp.]
MHFVFDGCFIGCQVCGLFSAGSYEAVSESNIMIYLFLASYYSISFSGDFWANG